ncbi:MAG TPA: oligopeptidase A, partial [Legionella sp.]|nr:oligopeptidase A [Legionella sp.]
MVAISLPLFTLNQATGFPDRLRAMLAANLDKITQILHETTVFTWDNLMRPLEDMEDALERFWSPLSHLHAVVNSQDLRECYQACLPQLSAYETAIGHNQALYAAVKSLDRASLDSIQCKIVDDAVRDFSLSGVALSAENKRRFEAVSARLADLSNQFENNVLDAVHAYQLHITDGARLTGMPEHAVHNAQALAQEKGLPGWILTLEFPCYHAVVTHATDRSLREALYRAFVTRASDQGPSAGQFDNTAVMNEKLAIRHEKAQLLGFANYAELSLATKMADSTDEVLRFLSDLSLRARPQAEIEFQRLQAFANETCPGLTVAPWDIAYLSEQKMQSRFSISQEELRPYFPLQKVMNGMFSIVNTLYGMTFERVDGVDTWHPDVTCYCILDHAHGARGYIYIDLFARPHKRGGAWMDSCQSRRRLADGSIQLPIALLTCNFAKAIGKQEPTLSHDEVLTLFHEFGHCLHHVLTQVDYLDVSGIHGVEWDAVELPSQFFENWCWEEQALQRLTAHVDTGESLSPTLFKKLIAVKNFQSAMGMMRQLEFSLFDFRIHQEYDAANPAFIENILEDVRKQTTVTPIAPYNRFQHSFSHIFGGGYAAGYYS